MAWRKTTWLNNREHIDKMNIDAITHYFTRTSDLVDLTHPLHTGMPTWPSHPMFCQEVLESFDTGHISCNHALAMSEHTGTHFDAPQHFLPDGAGIDSISMQTFFGRMVVIKQSNATPGQAIGLTCLKEFEQTYGSVEEGDAVFFHFGWDRFWNDPPENSRFLRDWPGLSREVAEALVERKVRIVGTDCLSIDAFPSQDFPAHKVLLGAGILVGENFARLGEIPDFSFLVTLPLPIRNGSGSPLRAIASFNR